MQNTSWILLPFIALWKLLTFFLKLTGRVVLLVLGLFFMIAGLILALTLIALPVAIPLIMLGLLLMIRSIF